MHFQFTDNTPQLNKEIQFIDDPDSITVKTKYLRALTLHTIFDDADANDEQLNIDDDLLAKIKAPEKPVEIEPEVIAPIMLDKYVAPEKASLEYEKMLVALRRTRRIKFGSRIYTVDQLLNNKGFVSPLKMLSAVYASTDEPFVNKYSVSAIIKRLSVITQIYKVK